MNDYENVSITLSSDDLIAAYRSQLARLSEENALLSAQVTTLLRNQQLGVVNRLSPVVGDSDLDSWDDADRTVMGQITG